MIKALLVGREKVKGLSVLSLEVKKDFCDVWTSLLLHLTFFQAVIKCSYN